MSLIKKEINITNDLKKECQNVFSNKEMLAFAKSLKPKYIGILKNSEAYDDINRGRVYASPSAFYGHRYGKSVAVITDIRNEHMDLFVTDSDGFLMNNVEFDATLTRINKTKKRGGIVISIFGGSTIEGMGSQRPEYTIPSLVERILKEKYSIDACVVNHGLGGTMSTESLNILINEALDYSPDIVIFYDGWNCCSYHSFNERIRMSVQNLTNNEAIPIPYPGSGMRQFEHDMILRQQNNIHRLTWRVICLNINKISISIIIALEKISKKLTNFFYLRKICTAVLGIVFPIRASSSPKINIMMSKAQSPTEINLVAKKSVSNYIKTHNITHSICNSNKIKFFTFLQPLLVYGKSKELTSKEKEWKSNGFSSGNPEVFKEFYEELIEKSRDLKYFNDLSDSFVGVKQRLYIDSGHLNKSGNLIISEKIVDNLLKEDCVKKVIKKN